jgi:hypothetical protein
MTDQLRALVQTSSNFDSGSLCCPICGEECGLHHKSVEVFWRNCEDAKTGIHLESSQEVTNFSNSMDGCPSLRRDGVRMLFTCENGCHESHQLALCLGQHKGQTLVYWDITPFNVP